MQAPVPHAFHIPTNYQTALQHFIEFYPHIEMYVSNAMRADAISAAHLQIATRALQQHLIAALELGDIRRVGPSLRWLEGLLVNYGVPTSLLTRFLEIYQHAIQTHIPAIDQTIFSDYLIEFRRER